MKKILIIDDTTDRWEEYALQFSSYVTLSKNIEHYFHFTRDGNDTKLLLDPDEYAYIFIHHSQSGDSIIPSNGLDSLKFLLGFSLVLFSGTLDDVFENKRDEGFVHHSLKRETMATKIRLFIRKSLLMENWRLEIFYTDFQKMLKGSIMQKIDRHDLDTEHVMALEETRLLAKYNRIDENSAQFASLSNLNPEEILEKLTQ